MNTPSWSIKKIERYPLATYASIADKSKGRVYPEKPHLLRTDFQRDKDRIVHSAAFRRLDYKTQVFVPKSCDHFRTRLTHSIEVSGLSRTIARSLGLNEDLTETIALAHDIGHPPFGHFGEKCLNDMLKDCGGFDHNSNALRVVDFLEEKYPGYPGLNLTWETRSSLLKHRHRFKTLDGNSLPPQLLLEAQVANVADSITYQAHDLDDGILAGIINPNELENLEFWQLAREHGKYMAIDESDERYIPFMIRNCIDMCVADTVQNSMKQILSLNIIRASDAEHLPNAVITLSKPLESARQELRKFLFDKLYRHPQIIEGNDDAEKYIKGLFKHFTKSPEDLGRRSRRRIEEIGLKQTIGDYISMMTDRYATEQYKKFIC